MSKARIRYFEDEDVLHLVISDEPEFRSVELSPNITESSAEAARRNPRLSRVMPDHLSRCAARSRIAIPYLVFYVVRPTRVSVLTVLHSSRSPATWPRR